MASFWTFHLQVSHLSWSQVPMGPCHSVQSYPPETSFLPTGSSSREVGENALERLINLQTWPQKSRNMSEMPTRTPHKYDPAWNPTRETIRTSSVPPAPRIGQTVTIPLGRGMLVRQVKAVTYFGPVFSQVGKKKKKTCRQVVEIQMAFLLAAEKSYLVVIQNSLGGNWGERRRGNIAPDLCYPTALLFFHFFIHFFSNSLFSASHVPDTRQV